MPAGDCHDLSQLSSVDEDRLLAPPRLPPVQRIRTAAWTRPLPHSKLLGQQEGWRGVPILRHEIIDDPNQRRSSDEAQSGQLSDGLRTAAQSGQDKPPTRSVEPVQPPRADARRCDSPSYGYSDEQREAGDDGYNGDNGGAHSEPEYGDGEDDDCVQPQDCDWGTNGGGAPADWDRINAEDQMFLNGDDEPAPLGSPMPNHDVYPVDRHPDQPKEAIIDENDFCENSEEERRAINQQLRLSQHSSAQNDHATQPAKRADAREKSSAARGKARATESQLQA